MKHSVKVFKTAVFIDRKSDLSEQLHKLKYVCARAFNRAVLMLLDRAVSGKMERERESGEKPPEMTLAYRVVSKEFPELTAAQASVISSLAFQHFRSFGRDILGGNRGIPCSRVQRVPFRAADMVKFRKTDSGFEVELKLRKETGKPACCNFTLPIRIHRKTRGAKELLERICAGEVKHGNVSLRYHKPKREWLLYIEYKMPVEPAPGLDASRICGCFVGIQDAMALRCIGQRAAPFYDGSDLMKFRAQMRERRRRIQSQPVTNGKGRGKISRALAKIGDKEKRFLDTKMHQLSRAAVDYAVRCGCGVIAVNGSVRGKADDWLAKNILRNWWQHDLVSKITYKARDAGIKVIEADPYFLTQRCPECGFVHADNRRQAAFECVSCGRRERRASLAAALNLCVPEIEKLIAEERERQEEILDAVEV